MAVALLSVPYDGSSSSRRGAAQGPAAIRQALERMRDYSNAFTESGVDLGADGVLRNAGDVPCGTPDATRAAIERSVADVLALGERPLVLGGDHSITYPVLRALRAAIGPVDVLHLDAHPALYPEVQGDPYSHACPFARALEAGLVGRLVQVGVRSITPPQREVAEQYQVEMMTMQEWGRPLGFFFEAPVYVSLDLDVLDPAFAPAVSHPEPGGLSTREVLQVLQRVHGTVIGADLVEFNPSADEHGRTAGVCAKLVKELVALLDGR
jgi:agmatinase